MPPTSKDLFHIEQYKALKSEVDMIQKHGYFMEVAIITGLASFYVFTSGKSELHWLIYFFPFILSCIATLKKLSLSRRMNQLGEYLSKLEQSPAFKGDEPSWHSPLNRNNWVTKFFWGGLCLSSFIYAVYNVISPLRLALCGS